MGTERLTALQHRRRAAEERILASKGEYDVVAPHHSTLSLLHDIAADSLIEADKMLEAARHLPFQTRP